MMDKTVSRFKRITALILCFILFVSVSGLLPKKALAYEFESYKMGGQIWYQASEVFTGLTREEMRLAMASWNYFIPEYRRVCYNTTVHTDPTWGFLTDYCDGHSYIYKQPINDSTTLAVNHIALVNFTDIVFESDIVVNSNQSWWNGANPGCVDIESCILHEVGHTLGLAHSPYFYAVMYATLAPNSTKRVLNVDDIDGLEARYE